MTLSRGSAPYGLMQPYESLVDKLDDLAASSDCGSITRIGHFTRTEADQFEFVGYLYLANWRQKPYSPKGRLQILVKAQETIRAHDDVYVLERSTVRVGYYDLNGENALLLHGIHFDHGPAQESHPIFHAQVTNDLVPLGGFAAELRVDFEQVPCARMQGYARIPTSDMSLPSVLLCLAADHIKPELFIAFLGEVRTLQERMPVPTFEKTRASVVQESNHLRSSHWFAHTQGY